MAQHGTCQVTRDAEVSRTIYWPYEEPATPLNTVHLGHPAHVHIHDTFNIEQIKPYHDPVKG